MENQIKITTADPTSLGLFSLAIVALIEATSELGLAQGIAFMVPWVFFLGGIAQLFAARLDARNNSIFGTTVWGLYGAFWISHAFILLAQSGILGSALQASGDERLLGMVDLGYLIFTIFVTIAAMETNKVLFFIILLLDIEFLGDFLGAFHIMSSASYGIAAVAELLVGVLSFYCAGAVLINTCFNKALLPLGKPFGVFVK
ncbi:acetate uptake transporter [Bacillus sp. EB600]|uniref:acetate uptake transporter n=1 Tax=Bacillus sp. EB600 TaxID=2806345 RepID=UPI002109DB6A|nr:acetate uptake transporter [Bacillus sp. EB600]MCQ6282457.1 acetate uptake transporter [Bacillus sp. EB600]